MHQKCDKFLLALLYIIHTHMFMLAMCVRAHLFMLYIVRTHTHACCARPEKWPPSLIACDRARAFRAHRARAPADRSFVCPADHLGAHTQPSSCCVRTSEVFARARARLRFRCARIIPTHPHRGNGGGVSASHASTISFALI